MIKQIMRLALVLCLAVLVSGCMLTKQVPVSCQFDVLPDTTAGKTALNKNIEELTNELKANPEANSIKHLRLAMLLIHRNNPNPDYKRAISEMEIFLSLNKEAEGLEDVKNIKALLENLYNEKEACKDAKEACKDEIEACKENIRKLQSIGLEMERKRRNIRGLTR